MLAGVHMLPVILSKSLCATLSELQTVSPHHDDGGHGGYGGHNQHRKTLKLHRVAQALWPHVSTLALDHAAASVDPMMKLYRLPAGAGEVGRHTDDDFDGPDGTRALYSVLVYLNDDFEGGETIFVLGGAEVHAPPHKAGAALVFKHDLVHAGLKVLNGTKYVLKTDLFVRPI